MPNLTVQHMLHAGMVRGVGVLSAKKNLTDAMAYTISYIYCNVEF